jgi:hypothetical protein
MLYGPRFKNHNPPRPKLLKRFEPGVEILHRYDGTIENKAGPAVIVDAGRPWSYRNAGIKAIKGPAELWFRNDCLHRLDGPALTLGTGGLLELEPDYLIDDHLQAKLYFNQPLSIWVQGKVHNNLGPAIVYVNGRQEWWQDGRLHREEDPAIIEGGIKHWYRFGKRWRDAGLPEVEVSEGATFHHDGLFIPATGPAGVWFKDGLVERIGDPV